MKNGTNPRKEVKSLKAVVFTTKNTAYVRDFKEPMSQTAEEVVGDWVERVRPVGLPGYLMLVNENGLLRDLQVNVAGSLFYGTQFHGNPIVGDIVIAKDNRQKIPRELTDKQVQFVFSEAKRLAKVYGQDIRWEES